MCFDCTILYHLKVCAISGFFLQRLNLKDGTDRLSRNVGKIVLFYAAQNPRRTPISKKVIFVMKNHADFV